MPKKTSPLRELLQIAVDTIGLDTTLDEMASIVINKSKDCENPVHSKLFEDVGNNVRKMSQSIPDLLTGRNTSLTLPAIQNSRLILIVLKGLEVVYAGLLTRPNLAEAIIKTGPSISDTEAEVTWHELCNNNHWQTEDRNFIAVPLL